MTVITKGLGDKKADNLQEPLVDNIVIEPSDEVRYRRYSIIIISLEICIFENILNIIFERPNCYILR